MSHIRNYHLEINCIDTLLTIWNYVCSTPRERERVSEKKNRMGEIGGIDESVAAINAGMILSFTCKFKHLLTYGCNTITETITTAGVWTMWHMRKNVYVWDIIQKCGDKSKARCDLSITITRPMKKDVREEKKNQKQYGTLWRTCFALNSFINIFFCFFDVISSFFL